MNTHLACLLAVFATAVLAQAPDPEPTYEGKPVSYWLPAFIEPGRPSYRPDISCVTASKAMRELGMKAAPHILRYTCTNGAPAEYIRSGWFNFGDSYRIMNRAFQCFAEKDKAHARGQLHQWLEDENYVVRANAVMLIWSQNEYEYREFSCEFDRLARDRNTWVRKVVLDWQAMADRQHGTWLKATNPCPE